MAVKLAAAMGAEVTVLSSTSRKEEDGKRLGADALYATKTTRPFTEAPARPST